MSQYSTEDKQRILQEISERAALGEKVKDIVAELQVSERSYRRWKQEGASSSIIELPEFPEDDIPISEIIEQRKKEFEIKYKLKQSLKWYPIKVKTEEPIAITFVGDPHIDNDGCNWSQLEADIDILANTDYMYAVGLGDQTDNWIGRLERLYSNSNMSKSRGLKLLEWFIADSGIQWMSLISGNHDQWSGADSPLKYICKQNNITLLDSINKFELQFSNGRICKVDARHNFKGHSLWNSLHGPQKAAHMNEPANIYVCGHLHNWAYHQEESASKEFIYHLIRVRGYKHIDHYAIELGHDEQHFGSSITAVIDPRVPEFHPNFITIFIDVQRAADYLTFLRSK